MDVQAYLRRINFQDLSASGLALPDLGRPSSELLRLLHRAHLVTVPFENLDISLGREITCDEARILDKIINQNRGGFCYELNGAFAALLRALGFEVSLLSARVAGEDGSLSPEFDHLTLLVHLEEPWLADVGFGDCFLDPLRLASSDEQVQGDRTYRIVPSDSFFTLEVKAAGKWKKEYAFTLAGRELRDFAERCHYHQTSSDSHFTRGRICSLARPEGRVTLSERTLSERRSSEQTSSEQTLIETSGGSRRERFLSGDEEYSRVLRELFGVVLPKKVSPKALPNKALPREY